MKPWRDMTQTNYTILTIYVLIRVSHEILEKNSLIFVRGIKLEFHLALCYG